MSVASEPIPRKGSGDAQPRSSDFASVRVVETGESLSPDPLRGIGSVSLALAMFIHENLASGTA